MDVMQAIRTRRSIRSYRDADIPEDIYQNLLKALRFAPSACNFQPWRFVLVRDAKLRSQLAQACRGQSWIAGAPLVVVACGLAQSAYQKMGGQHNSVEVDLAIALDHLSLAAVAHGLGTCWIGAFSEPEVKALLNLPGQTRVVALMPVGFPQSDDLNRPITDTDRKPPEQVFGNDRQS